MSDASLKHLKPGDHVYLIDGSGYIFRAYHALPPLTRKSDGLPVGAVQGFCNMLHKLLKEMKAGESPSHLAVIFDKSSKTFRNDIYPQYKAQRPDTPEDLIPQFGLIRTATQAFNVPSIDMEGYEADDLIATYATQAKAAGATVRIISSDKDLMQLVEDGVTLYDAMKDRVIGPEQVVEKFGVDPKKVVEVQALAGDSVDNIPGVPGIGVKTGAQLINDYGDLETLLARAEEIKQPKRRQNLIEFAEQARISRVLVELKRDVPVENHLAEFGVREPEAKSLIGFFKALEFNSLTRKLATELDADANEIDALSLDIAHWVPPQSGATSIDEVAPDSTLAIKDIPLNHGNYETITDMTALDKWLNEARDSGVLCVDTETTSLDAMQADLVGVALALEPGKACYIPLAHRSDDGFAFDGPQIKQLPKADVIARLKKVLEDPGILKIGQNLKYDLLILRRVGINLQPFDDTMLMSYTLDSGQGGHGMDELAARHLGLKPISFKDVAGSGKSAITFDLVAVDKASIYAAEDADITLRLWHILRARLVREHKMTVYQTLERPLAPVLAAMEFEGIMVDRAVLARLSGEFAKQGNIFEAKAHQLAGENFNLGSPKQLGQILFEKLGLQGGRKTGTGAWSTDSQTLEDLSAQGVELARTVLDWRQMAKLRSTYSDALPGHINPQTGRVHTSYAMASTSTGRLASTDPNLQNIPIRSEEGRKIRTAFIAPAGKKLISADYSQIELRVLAHVADIPQLKKAFAEGLDIHAMTASEMFNVPIADMDPMVRRRAKAINFGIIYGISAFGLANQLAIGREEASAYIKTYFQRFPGIKDYMDTTKSFAARHGYVETIFGRRAHFPRLPQAKAAEKAFMERAAINAPIQGAAADIIRRAMVRMPDALSIAGIKAKMLLQVHDELILEADDGEVEATIAIVVAVMEAAAEPAIQLSVPIKVDARAALNWDEAH